MIMLQMMSKPYCACPSGQDSLGIESTHSGRRQLTPASMRPSATGRPTRNDSLNDDPLHVKYQMVPVVSVSQAVLKLLYIVFHSEFC